MKPAPPVTSMFIWMLDVRGKREEGRCMM